MVKRILKFTYLKARKIIILVVGLTILLLGFVLILTPAPGGLVIFSALALLATEAAWARWLLKRLKKTSSLLSYHVVRLLPSRKRLIKVENSILINPDIPTEP